MSFSRFVWLPQKTAMQRSKRINELWRRTHLFVVGVPPSTSHAYVGSLLSMRYIADSIKENALILRRLAKRGLEGRTTLF